MDSNICARRVDPLRPVLARMMRLRSLWGRDWARMLNVSISMRTRCVASLNWEM